MFINTLFQNCRYFIILLFTCKLALVASFTGKYSFAFRVQERTGLKKGLGNFPDPCEVLEIILLYSMKMQDKEAIYGFQKNARASVEKR